MTADELDTAIAGCRRSWQLDIHNAGAAVCLKIYEAEKVRRIRGTAAPGCDSAGHKDTAEGGCATTNPKESEPMTDIKRCTTPGCGKPACMTGANKGKLCKGCAIRKGRGIDPAARLARRPFRHAADAAAALTPKPADATPKVASTQADATPPATARDGGASDRRLGDGRRWTADSLALALSAYRCVFPVRLPYLVVLLDSDGLEVARIAIPPERPN